MYICVHPVFQVIITYPMFSHGILAGDKITLLLTGCQAPERSSGEEQRCADTQRADAGACCPPGGGRQGHLPVPAVQLCLP